MLKYETTSLFCSILLIISLASFISFSFNCLLDSFFANFASAVASRILLSNPSNNSELSVGSIFIEKTAPISFTIFPSHPSSTLVG